MFLGGYLSKFFVVFVDFVLGEFVVVSVNIDLVGVELICLFLDEIIDLEDDDDGKGEVRFEEVFDIVEVVVDGVDGDEKLSD